ncbi:MAG TPA: ribonuclease HI family protein [Thermomicrobiales bacterium]|nr:ribonuclease HI family protein [Thermomicrobiales bacterium]
MPDTPYTQEALLRTTPPESREFDIVFDGGSLGNPGKGYGSYEIMSAGEVYHGPHRHEYGDRITNNQAEYMTLIEALKWLASDLGDDRKRARVRIHGDSRLVVNQVNGVWKVKHANMIPLVDQVKKLFKEFGSCTIEWHPRAKSVERLGH